MKTRKILGWAVRLTCTAISAIGLLAPLAVSAAPNNPPYGQACRTPGAEPIDIYRHQGSRPEFDVTVSGVPALSLEVRSGSLWDDFTYGSLVVDWSTGWRETTDLDDVRIWIEYTNLDTGHRFRCPAVRGSVTHHVKTSWGGHARSVAVCMSIEGRFEKRCGWSWPDH